MNWRVGDTASGWKFVTARIHLYHICYATPIVHINACEKKDKVSIMRNNNLLVRD